MTDEQRVTIREALDLAQIALSDRLYDGLISKSGAERVRVKLADALAALDAPPPVVEQPLTGAEAPTGAIAGHCFDIDGNTWHKDGYVCVRCGFGYSTIPPEAPAEPVSSCECPAQWRPEQLVYMSQRIGEAVEETQAETAALIREARDIFAWLLGENGDFPARPDGGGAYWWRNDLREKLHTWESNAGENFAGGTAGVGRDQE